MIIVIGFLNSINMRINPCHFSEKISKVTLCQVEASVWKRVMALESLPEFIKTILDKTFEARVTTPHRFKPKSFLMVICMRGPKSNHQRTMIRFGSR